MCVACAKAKPHRQGVCGDFEYNLRYYHATNTSRSTYTDATKVSDLTLDTDYAFSLLGYRTLVSGTIFMQQEVLFPTYFTKNGVSCWGVGCQPGAPSWYVVAESTRVSLCYKTPILI
jgi:hypothetical protein